MVVDQPATSDREQEPPKSLLGLALEASEPPIEQADPNGHRQLLGRVAPTPCPVVIEQNRPVAREQRLQRPSFPTPSSADHLVQRLPLISGGLNAGAQPSAQRRLTTHREGAGRSHHANEPKEDTPLQRGTAGSSCAPATSATGLPPTASASTIGTATTRRPSTRRTIPKHPQSPSRVSAPPASPRLASMPCNPSSTYSVVSEQCQFSYANVRKVCKALRPLTSHSPGSRRFGRGPGGCVVPGGRGVWARRDSNPRHLPTEVARPPVD